MPAHSFTESEAAPLIYFANERHAIYLRRSFIERKANERGLVPMSRSEQQAWGSPSECWGQGYLTKDRILREYRFCNVFRELDRVTVWIRENIREPFVDQEHLWFMLAVARFINWPPTLKLLIEGDLQGEGWVSSWPRDNNARFSLGAMTGVMERIKELGDKVETGAYMIRAESDPKKEWYTWSKQRYVSEIVLGRPWQMREAVRDFFNDGPTLHETWTFFTEARQEADWVGWGPFMAGQIVADLRHTRYLRDAQDVGRWAPLGPGSTRGLNRLAGRSLKQSIPQQQGLDEMLQLQAIVNAHSAEWVPSIELHDIQNVLCETDKYLRVKTGEGRPRAQYIPGRGH